MLSLSLPLLGADSSDLVLKAMRDELQHSRALDSVNLEKPYFISYTIEEGEGFADLGQTGRLARVRPTPGSAYPRVQVRVGDYQFDNTNYVGRAGFGSRYDIDPFPLEDLYPVLRRYLWLATDQVLQSGGRVAGAQARGAEERGGPRARR